MIQIPASIVSNQIPEYNDQREACIVVSLISCLEVLANSRFNPIVITTLSIDIERSLHNSCKRNFISFY